MKYKYGRERIYSPNSVRLVFDLLCCLTWLNPAEHAWGSLGRITGILRRGEGWFFAEGSLAWPSRWPKFSWKLVKYFDRSYINFCYPRALDKHGSPMSRSGPAELCLVTLLAHYERTKEGRKPKFAPWARMVSVKTLLKFGRNRGNTLIGHPIGNFFSRWLST